MMESDINADQNFYRRPHHVLPSSSSDHDQQQHHDYHTPYNSPPTHTDLEARSPKVPPKLPYLTTQNLHAVTSNGYVGGEGGGDPDDFYKQYRGVQSSSNGYGDSPNGMAATVSESRPGPSSLRSNSNGTTPKHPPVSGLRNGLKQPGYRSASSPLDGRTALSNAKSSPALNGASNSSQKPSVKDLLKRFDQNNQPSAPPAAPAVPAVRKPAPRIPPKDVGISSTAYARTRATNSSSNTLGNTRAGQATRDTGVGAGNHATVPRTTQRTRFATEDQHSNNALSSTARTTKPRIAVPGSNGFASKSMSNLSPSSQTHPQSPPAARRPLFGEVSSTGTVNLPDIGYNVTGQTNIRRLAHSRSRSEIVEAIPPSPSSPSSPTAWYRSVNRELGSGLPQRSPRLINGHNRAHSDSPDAKANPLKNINTSSLKTGLPRPSPTRLSPHTRIATATSRFNTPSSSSSPSPPSTRAVSPYAAKSAASTKLRKPEPRSTTPTAGRAQTPTSRTPRGKARSPGKVGTNNASLKAYISSPPPKTSPPLRSSRPRQPVSSASTASSRQKTRERSQSAVRERAGSPKPVRTGMRVTRTNSTPSSRDQSPKPRRILTSGPVDFAARREKVQRAYTKSIHASEQKEIRARNLQRLNERRAVEANSKKETEALTAEKAAPVNLPTETSEAPAEPLQVTTNFSPPNWTPPVIPQAPVIQQIPPDVDSPTLGIPGSFPGEKNVDDEIEEPQSAISNATGVTEIDVEPQTAPAQMSVLPSESSMEPSMLSQEVYIPESSAEITPQLPEEGHEDVQEAPQVEVHEDDVHEDDVHEERDGHDDSAIPIFLDATPAETSIPSPLPSPKSPNPPGAFMQDAEYVEYEEPLSPYDPLARDPSPPGAFQEESPELTPNIAEHDQPVFATTITSASPLATPEPPELQVPREHPEARTPPESGDEREFVDDTIHAEVVVEDLSQSTCSDLAPAEYESPTVEEFAVQDQDEDESKAPHLRLPMLRSALSAHRDSDYLMTPTTDIDYESSNEHSSVSGQRDTSQTQNRDQLSPGMYYDKRQSVWTDFSVNSGDEFSDQEYYEHYPLDLALTLSDPEKKPVPPPKTSPVVPPKPNNYTPQASPRFLRETPHLESPHQLPPVSTDTGLGLGFAESTLGYGSQVTSVVPLWPEYTPPPVPVEDTAPAVPAPPTRTPPPPSIHNRGPSSSIHRSSQYESRRPSEDVYSPRHSTSTPRSSAQMSAEDVSTSHQSFVDVAKQVERLMTSGAPPTVPTTAPNTFETEEDRIAAEKEKKRLYQRMRIIKELIETEAVYLKDMNVVEEIYKGTAEACPKLEETDVKSIFRNTDEVVAFTTTFLDELKAAGSSVFTTRKPKKRESQATNATANRFSTAETLNQETDDQKDRKTFIGRTFGKHLKQMQEVYTDFLKNSEIASTRLTALQADPAVKVWLQECNLVAKDLTAAWSLDALLVKPVQRITRYKLLLADLSKHTTENHPDYQSIQSSMAELDSLLKNIDDLKRRIDMVGKIVGRKRKESDVRSGIAKAFGRRAEKLQSSNSHRPNDDETYLKLHEKYQDDYLRLQVVLRDVEFYTRQSSSYVNDFLRYLSSIELVMRLSASPYPEIESKWARFNMGMRDMGTVALEEHLQSVRQRVIQPFEQVIQAYSAPGLAMKKRNKRRLDYEKSLQLKNSGKKIDEKLSELVDQYEALNETLKFELPKLSQLTEKIGNICLGHFVSIQAHWFNIWQEKVKVVLEESQMAKEIGDIVDMFARDYKYVEARAQELGIVNGTFLDSSPKTARASQSTRDDGASMTSKGRPSNISSRSRGLSIRSDTSPSLPTPDFAKRNSGQFTFSPILSQAPGLPAFAPRDPSFSNGHSRAGSGSPATPNSDSPNKYGAPSVPRPGTGRSFTSNDGLQRPSNDYNEPYRRQSGSTYNSNHHIDGPPQSGRPYSGLFHSAMPLPDGPEDSQRSSRASSRDRNVSGGYNVLYLAASLFEFNISATKSEAGYPYLTYQAGEIFDVIGEKGELWLAKNQDDPMDSVGWIWSKHFARLATD